MIAEAGASGTTEARVAAVTDARAPEMIETPATAFTEVPASETTATPASDLAGTRAAAVIETPSPQIARPPRPDIAHSLPWESAAAVIAETPRSANPAPPLAERLARQQGGRAAAPGAAVDDATLAALVGGRLLAPGLVEHDETVCLPAAHGRMQLEACAEIRLPYLGIDRTAHASDLLFIDTETTGLAGGTGTLPFLVGMARFEGEALRVRQLFLTGFAGEAALLEALATWVAPGVRLVSFNGKAFDVPLLATRFRLARMADPLSCLDHVDLLHPTRNAFARRWVDCRLQTAEAHLFGLTRNDDLPGHLIPYAWFNFVRSRVPGEVPRILEHNRWDVRSLAALLRALEEVYDAPASAQADTLGVARTHRRRGAESKALDMLAADAGRLDARGRLELAAMYRRQGEWAQAVALWTDLHRAGCDAATEHLAKYHEHEARDPATALIYAEALVARHPQSAAHAQRRGRLLRRLPRPPADGS